MTGRIEPTGTGWVVRDEQGRTTATVTVSTGPLPGQGSLLVMHAGGTLELPLGLSGLLHGATVFARNFTEAAEWLQGDIEKPDRAVPRAEPDPRTPWR